MNLALEQAVASRVRDMAQAVRAGDLLAYYDAQTASLRESTGRCRCGAPKADYCAACGTELCAEHMRAGCCGSVPARSEWAEDRADLDVFVPGGET